MVLAAEDPDGPLPRAGQFYMLAAARRWGGGADERPFLPRAFSVLRARDDRLEFMLEAVGPGTERLCELEPGDGLHVTGPLGLGFPDPPDDRRALLCGGGVGTAPLAIWQDELLARGEPAPALLGFRDADHAPGATLLHNARVATDDGSHGHHGLVTDLLADELDAGAAGRRVRVRPAAHARGGAGAVRRARRPLPARARGGHGLRLRGLLRLRRAPARRRLPAPVRRRARPRRRPAGGGAGALTGVDFCGLRLAHPIVNGSGTFDAIAARRAFGDAVLEQFPFAAFVSKTITLAPRDGNPPPRLYETPAGLVNSIGLPNKGLRGYLEHDLPELARLPVPLITNVMGSTAAELCALVEALDERDEVDALELNVSCPNVSTGLDIGADPGELAAVLGEVRPRTAKPLIVKLTPNTADVAAVAQAAQEAGADAVSLINTLRAYAPHPAVASATVSLAGQRDRRTVGSGHPRGRPRAGARGRRARLDPGRRHGRRAERPTRRAHARRGRDAGRRGHRELPRSGRGNTDLTRA